MNKKTFQRLGIPALAAATPASPLYQALIDQPPEGWSEDDFQNFIETEFEADPIVVESGGINLTVGTNRSEWGWSIRDPKNVSTAGNLYPKIYGYVDLLRWPANLTKAQAISKLKITFDIRGSSTSAIKPNSFSGSIIDNVTGETSDGWNSSAQCTIAFVSGTITNAYIVRFLMAGCEFTTNNVLTGQRWEGADFPKCENLRHIISSTGATKILKQYHNKGARDSYGNLLPNQISSNLPNGGFIFNGDIAATDIVQLITTNTKSPEKQLAN